MSERVDHVISGAYWTDERRRWAAFYAHRLADQLQAAVGLIAVTPPEGLHFHFDSLLALLNATSHQPDLATLWLDMVDRLHPLPVRWGQWSTWLTILHEADQKATQLGLPVRRAEYLAHTAELLLNVGQSGQALDAANAAMGLAQPYGAAWPLSKGANAAAATLRSMARYDEAQAIIDEVRAVIADMAAPKPVTRAAMAEALLDLEQMDLLRYFNRLDDALVLGERLIANLSVVEGIDPHDIAGAYLRRATIMWVSGRYQEAVDDLTQSAALFRKAGDELQATFAEANLGLVYYSMSRYREAEALKLAAIHAAEEINARHVLVSELGDMSTIYIGLGHMDLAFDYANRMVELAAELDNMAELSRGRGNRGYTLLGLGRYDEALDDIEFSLDLYRRQGRLEGTIITMVDKILYLQGIGDKEQATRLARENYEAAWREDFPHLHIVTSRCLALFLPASEQEALLRKTLTLARGYERPMDEAGCLFSLAAVTDVVQERINLYQQAVELVEQMGCMAWLESKSVDEPPQLPMII